MNELENKIDGELDVDSISMEKLKHEAHINHLIGEHEKRLNKLELDVDGNAGDIAILNQLTSNLHIKFEPLHGWVFYTTLTTVSFSLGGIVVAVFIG